MEKEILKNKLKHIFEEQERRQVLEHSNIGGVTATRDKHSAILLLLDYIGDKDIEFFFDQIR